MQNNLDLNGILDGSHVLKLNKSKANANNILHVILLKIVSFGSSYQLRKRQTKKQEIKIITLRFLRKTPSGLIVPKFLNSSSISEADMSEGKFLTYTDLNSTETRQTRKKKMNKQFQNDIYNQIAAHPSSLTHFSTNLNICVQF